MASKKASNLTDIPTGEKKKTRKPRAIEAAIVKKEQEIAKTGRPTTYSHDIAAIICERITEGDSLRSICREDDMPAISTIFKWQQDYPIFMEQYARAKEEQADTNAEDIQQIAKDTLKGKYDPASARVAIDAYKWTASKLKPKRYGDKLDVTSDGEKLPTPLMATFLKAPDTNGDQKALTE